MKKMIWITVMIMLFCFISPIYAYDFEISSKNAILYNLDENKVLYEKNAQEEISIASLTKIMTAIVAIENSKSLEEKVVLISKDFEGLIEANAAVAGFTKGQMVTVRDLLYGLLLPSGADAAQALTRSVAGSKNKFVEMMNAKAKELGMHHTNFVNETGLDENGHYSTLEDVAIMFQYALKNNELKMILQSDTYEMSDGSFTISSTISKNIKKYQLGLNYILGGKTGTTNDAGLCLASIASSNGTNYMLVTARAPYPAKQPYSFLDAKTIYDYFISHYENKKVVGKEELLLSLPTKYAKEDQIELIAEGDIVKYLPMEFDKNDIKMQYEGIEVVNFNTKKGTKLGVLELFFEEEMIVSMDIVLKDELHFSILKYIQAHMVPMSAIIIVIVGLIFCLIKIKKTRK